ncbi:hypothetical protein BS17DRAFT_780038 [Gyrodon lividus]|nr:hypothetical protein BS17DRAFT_780038 [Gyrodon lividus]
MGILTPENGKRRIEHTLENVQKKWKPPERVETLSENQTKRNMYERINWKVKEINVHV